MGNGKCHLSGLFLSESHFSWHIACTHEPDGDCSEGGKQREESSDHGREQHARLQLRSMCRRCVVQSRQHTCPLSRGGFRKPREKLQNYLDWGQKDWRLGAHSFEQKKQYVESSSNTSWRSVQPGLGRTEAVMPASCLPSGIDMVLAQHKCLTSVPALLPDMAAMKVTWRGRDSPRSQRGQA